MPNVRTWAALAAAAAGGGGVHRAAAQPAGAPCLAVPPSNVLQPPARVAMVVDGRVLAADRPGASGDSAARRVAALPADSIADLLFVSDSAGLARYGLCPGQTAMVVVTAAEARRTGYRPRPAALCLRSPASRNPSRMALPVGQQFTVVPGGVDMLGECDRPPPPGVRWTASDPTVLGVNSAGIVRGRAPGRAEVVATSDGGEARLTVTVVPPVARIAITPADTTVRVGDTVTFRALAYAPDGRPLPDVRLALSAYADGWPDPRLGPGQPGPALAQNYGRGGAPAAPNTVRVVAHRPGTGWVRAAVVGRADSVRVRTAAR